MQLFKEGKERVSPELETSVLPGSRIQVVTGLDKHVSGFRQGNKFLLHISGSQGKSWTSSQPRIRSTRQGHRKSQLEMTLGELLATFDIFFKMSEALGAAYNWTILTCWTFVKNE